MGKPLIKIGDVFEIPLSNGRVYYGQYVDNNKGPIVRIFDYFTDKGEKPDLENIDTSKLLFPPVHVGIKDPIRAKMWNVVGRLPLDNYQFAGYLSNYTEVPTSPEEGVRVKKWFFWNGEKSIDLGERLPDEYQRYEGGGVYSAGLIVERIETGFDMYAHAKKHNRYLTKDEVKEKYPRVKLD
jgi:Immunity protein 26